MTSAAAVRRPSGRLGGAGRVAAAGVAFLLAAASGSARAADIVATYSAYWAGLPAAQIRLKLSATGASYDDKIEIRSDGCRASSPIFAATPRQPEGSVRIGRRSVAL